MFQDSYRDYRHAGVMNDAAPARVESVSTSREHQPVLQGQARVLSAWLALAGENGWARRTDFDVSAYPRELAHLSLLALAPQGMRFRLAGGALKFEFGREARGLLASDIAQCRTSRAWTDAVDQALDTLAPVFGETRLPCGGVHFWLRLPLSSDGMSADLVLCHDRYLSADALDNPDLAARAADEALQRELFEPEAA